MRRPYLNAFLMLIAVVFAACQAEDDLTSPAPRLETVSINGVDLLVGDVLGERALILSDHDDDDDDGDDGDGDDSSGSGSGDDDGDDEDDDDNRGRGSGNRDSEWISRSSGGKLEISGAELRVSRNSISKSSQVVMVRSPDTFGIWTIRFEPSGLTFAPPARLTIEVEDISDVDPARLKIAGASSSHDDWQVLGGTYDPDEGTVSIDVFHFSRYALCVE